jgi:hypothetical protein
MIERASIFQLFWSKNSKRSKYVEQEWRHALEIKKDYGFIRPVYWDKPMPEPPHELSNICFEYMIFSN